MAVVVTKGYAELVAVLGATPERIQAAAHITVRQSAALIENKAKRNFIGSHRKGEPHIGGNRPNVVTGYARRSIISTSPRPTAAYGYSAKVGPTAIYGRRLELGFPGGVGPGQHATRPFPYLQPAVESSTWELRNIALTQWGRAFGT